MNLRDFALLTDENLHATVVSYLRTEGFDVFDVSEAGLHGTTDIELLQRSVSDGRVIVTHDADFGALAILTKEPVIGIVYLRPGHIDPQFTIQTIQTILASSLDIEVPFVIVARRSKNFVAIRLRKLDG